MVYCGVFLTLIFFEIKSFTHIWCSFKSFWNREKVGAGIKFIQKWNYYSINLNTGWEYTEACELSCRGSKKLYIWRWYSVVLYRNKTKNLWICFNCKMQFIQYCLENWTFFMSTTLDNTENLAFNWRKCVPQITTYRNLK